MRHPTWYWEYLRPNPKRLTRSLLQTDCPAPDLWTRIVVRVLLGWKLVIVKPGHTPPPRGGRRIGDLPPDSDAHLRIQALARRAAHKHYRHPPSRDMP